MKKYVVTDFGKSVIFSLCLLILTAIFVVFIYPEYSEKSEKLPIAETTISADEFRMVISFGELSAILVDNEFRHIEIAARLAKSSPEIILNVDGYAYDTPLAAARARAVAEYLIHIGVPEHQIVKNTKGGGDYAFLYFTKK